MDLAVEGIACGACIARSKARLKRLPGVTEARLNFTNRRLHVAWRDGATGAGADPAGARGHRLSRRIRSSRSAPSRQRRAEARRLTRCLAVAGFAAMNIMLLSVSVWSGNVTDITPETRDFFHWLSALIALPAAAYAGQPFFRSAWRALRSRALNMDVPISLGVILALGMSLVETANHAEHAYFDSAIMLLFFLLCRARARSRDAPQDARGRRQSGGPEGRIRASLCRRRTGERAGRGAESRATGCWSARRARAGRRHRARRHFRDRREPGHRRNRAPQGRSRRDDLCRQHEFFRRADAARDRRGRRRADRRDRAAAGQGGERQVAHDAACRPRRAPLCAGRAPDRRADFGRLAGRRRVSCTTRSSPRSPC